MSDPDFPLNRALRSGSFSDNLELLGHAIRGIIHDYRDYIALIYVDVVELDSTHMRKFDEGMAARFQAFIETTGMERKLAARLPPDLSPLSAVMLATRIFYNYFTVEILFGVKDHFGKETGPVVDEISRMPRDAAAPERRRSA